MLPLPPTSTLFPYTTLFRSLSWSYDHVGPMTRRVEDAALLLQVIAGHDPGDISSANVPVPDYVAALRKDTRSEEHTSELQSRFDLVCRLLLEKKKQKRILPS